MSAGPNLSPEELQHLHYLLTALQASQEFEDADPEDYDALNSTLTIINYVRTTRIEEKSK